MVDVSMKLEKSTKNTYRYSEVIEDKPPVLGTVYIQRYVLGSTPPKELKINLEW